MAKTEKIYYVANIHNGKTTIWEGTMSHFLSAVFGYSLECGNSWNNKIPTNPKTIKSLVKALNDSAYECRRYNDSFEESSKEEFDKANERVSVKNIEQ